MKKSKHSKNFLIFLILIAIVWYIGTFWIIDTTTEIYSDKINNEITIVHITDLHGSSFGKDNITLLEKIYEQEPDFVCVTGDMYTYGDDDGREVAISFMTELAKNYDTYFINGEHDSSESFCNELAENGVYVVNYEDEIITVGDTDIHLYGINNEYYSSTFNLNNAFDIDNENFTLLLAHASYFQAFADFGIDLSLCGDTHGGQVQLPFIGAIFNRGIWFPEIQGTGDTTYTDGLYELDNSYLYVSSGLGNYPYPIRFMNMPEVSVIKLLPEA